jgi:hypothetical protein
VSTNAKVDLEIEVPGDLARLHLPEGLDRRLQTLLDKQDGGTALSADEQAEAEGLVDLADLDAATPAFDEKPPSAGMSTGHIPVSLQRCVRLRAWFARADAAGPSTWAAHGVATLIAGSVGYWVGSKTTRTIYEMVVENSR